MINLTIDERDECEFFGELIDIVEDFLEARGITLNNEDKEYAIRCGEDPDGLAIIYGDDYGELDNDFRALIQAWERK